MDVEREKNLEKYWKYRETLWCVEIIMLNLFCVVSVTIGAILLFNANVLAIPELYFRSLVCYMLALFSMAGEICIVRWLTKRTLQTHTNTKVCGVFTK